MINGKELLEAIESIVEERKIDKKEVLFGIKEGFQKAYEKFFDTESIVRVDIDEKDGELKVFKQLKVVKDNFEDFDDLTEIFISDAKKRFDEDVQIGDTLDEPVLFDTEFSRLAIIQVRQIIQQRIKSAERAIVYSKFKDKINTIVSAKIISRDEKGFSYLVDIQGTNAILLTKKTIRNEKFYANQTINVYIDSLDKDNKISQISISRTDPKFLEKMIENRIPEVQEGIIEIKGVSREPGLRAKVSVLSHDEYIDPIGSIVGNKGSRIQNISEELNGEKIDIVHWDEDMHQYILNAMSPVKIISVFIDKENEECNVIVPNGHLSLAIGKGGMAARLVANLLKTRLNINSYDEAIEDNMEILWNGNITKEEMEDPNFLNHIQKRRTQNNNFTDNNSSFKPKSRRENNTIDLELLANAQFDIIQNKEKDYYDEYGDEIIQDIIETKVVEDKKVEHTKSNNFSKSSKKDKEFDDNEINFDALEAIQQKKSKKKFIETPIIDDELDDLDEDFGEDYEDYYK